MIKPDDQTITDNSHYITKKTKDSRLSFLRTSGDAGLPSKRKEPSSQKRTETENCKKESLQSLSVVQEV